MLNNNLLREFLKKAVSDKNLNPTHISLFTTLIMLKEEYNNINPMTIDKEEVMTISKINSKVTYHKCLKHLHDAGYLKYQPSFNPFIRSQIHFLEKKIKNKKTES